MRRISLIGVAAILAACGGGGASSSGGGGSSSSSTSSSTSSTSTSSSSSSTSSSSSSGGLATSSRCNTNNITPATLAVTSVVGGLANPWGMAFLPAPDGRILVTERAGRLRILLNDGTLSTPITGLPPNIAVAGQGGLLDVALDPDYATNNFIYLSFAESGTGGSGTAVARARLDPVGLALTNVTVIFRQTPKVGGNGHFGGRLVFDASNRLWVTMGDRQLDPTTGASHAAQNPMQTIGKIARVDTSGNVPADNPFVGQTGTLPEIWSIGHRNVQGAARHPVTGALWTAEHGAQGGDEINIPQAGKNYGWPVISYGVHYGGAAIGEGTAKTGLEQPQCYWDPSLAPSGMAFYTASRVPQWQGSLFVGTLAGQSLIRLTLNGTQVTGHERFTMGKRIRDVRQGPDGYLYLLTDHNPGEILRVTVN